MTHLLLLSGHPKQGRGAAFTTSRAWPLPCRINCYCDDLSLIAQPIHETALF